MTKLDKLKEKLQYWKIKFVYYDSFRDESITDYDSDGLVEEVIEELIEATKTRDDIYYKEQVHTIDKLNLKIRELEDKFYKIRRLL
jgi:hypothetical protein